ncbi:hypothetical protein [Nocardioides marmotae]|uniref:Uncharacterized protein n=1 Tax=Nocardioides marmotae TaxID=2663857 RepID=A0A6I3J5T7_9ACTN|nr:hypothetical protein [Nocardioides marmotae]MBC9731790.1 hypothetical protein [Nocardioides marmotae]MTB82912.1 hypothetical protein [Nocardioides marmotae]MTB94714.1 hypothetical protein [Nocardioides marmotae]QKE01284.1 hypothetical protein HPC71_09560 [Nocardioides marmotae]
MTIDSDLTQIDQPTAVADAATASGAAQEQDDFPIGMLANPIRTRI